MNDIHDMTGMVPLYQFIGVESDRDRLAAENAEFRKQVEDWKTGSAHEARYGDDARRDLAAATATLDRLREVVPEDEDSPEEWPYGNGPGCVRAIHAILYPKPTETPDE